MPSFKNRVRVAMSLFVFAAVVVSVIGCNGPIMDARGTLKIVVTAGTASDGKLAAPQGLAQVEEESILSLELRIDGISLISGEGDGAMLHPLFTGAATVDLVTLVNTYRLIGEIPVPAGTYSGIQFEIGEAIMTLSGFPGREFSLALASDTFIHNFPFEVTADGVGLLDINLGGLGVFEADTESFVFEPNLSAVIRNVVPNTRIEGIIADVDTVTLTLMLVTDDTLYLVDFSGADIFLPGDLLISTGTPDDLVAQARASAIGVVSTENDITPEFIEILDHPSTPEDDRGDRITLCHDPGFGVAPYTVVVSRSTLAAHLDHGDTIGPCGDPMNFALTYLAGENGTIDGVTTQLVLSGQNGSPVTAVPDTGFEFINWSDGSTANPRTDTNVTMDITVTANFGSEFTLSYAAAENGRLEGAATQTVLAGGSGTAVAALPETGFGFAGWSDGRTDNPRTDANVMANVNVTAMFSSEVTLTYTAGNNGSLEGVLVQTVGIGGSGTAVTAIPSEGFIFHRWTDGNTDNPRVDANVMADITVTANFIAQFTLTYLSGVNGSIEGNTAQVINAGANGATVTAVPDAGFGFVGWSDGSRNNPRTDRGVRASIVVTATFAEANLYTYVAGANGSISGTTPQRIVPGLQGSPVTPVANSGFAFSGWSDGNVDTPRIDIGGDEDITVTANFSPGVGLYYAADGHGSIMGARLQILTLGVVSTPVTAVPDVGYRFLDWSDASTQNPRIDLNVTESLSVTANFIEDLDMIPVAAGAFPMGNTGAGDDLTQGFTDEFPQHEVMLSAYEIGRFPITNNQLCEMLNYLHRRQLLRRDQAGNIWNAHNAHLFAGESLRRIVGFALAEVNVRFVNGQFVPKIKLGLPEGTVYDMGDHPATDMTWFGVAFYCNWRSEIEGLTPVYDTNTWEGNLANNGYRLPTEAEWERAAAWDADLEKHWIYGISSDTLEGCDRANRYLGLVPLPPPDHENTEFCNPQGLIQDELTPYTSPVGWFNGVNISPNGNIQTIDSFSPIGAYDMSGNTFEWCHDWYGADYYEVSPMIDPAGPTTGTTKVARGGAWGRFVQRLPYRTARRLHFDTNFADGAISFRVVRPIE